MPHQFRPILTFQSGAHEFSESTREELRACLCPHLRDPSDEGAAIHALAEAIGTYNGLLSAGVNDLPRDRKATLKELEALSGVAATLSEMLENLHPETRGRLTDWIEHVPAPGEEHGELAPIIDPQHLEQITTSVGFVAGRAEMVKSMVEEEKRPRGRPTDQAAWYLASACLDIFEHHCEGSTGYGSWIKRDGETDSGPFQKLLDLVFRAAGVERRSEWYLRQLHERRSKHPR